MSRTVRAVLPGLALLGVAALLIALAAALAPHPAEAQPDWAPVEEATITPGVQMVTDGAQCTANFIYTDGSDVLIGYAAHCAGTGGSTATDGCEAGTLPTGTEVEVEGASQPGTLVYSSWETMQDRGESDGDTCQFNDFALVALHPDDHASVNPTVPFWGGPGGVGDSTEQGDPVYSYGNSSLRGGIDALKPKEGVSLGQTAGGWNHQVYTATPGVPGDSGSGFLDSEGNAFGSLSTLQLAPQVGSNGVTDLTLALGYANQHGGMSAQVESGTQGFEAGTILRALLP